MEPFDQVTHYCLSFEYPLSIGCMLFKWWFKYWSIIWTTIQIADKYCCSKQYRPFSDFRRSLVTTPFIWILDFSSGIRMPDNVYWTGWPVLYSLLTEWFRWPHVRNLDPHCTELVGYSDPTVLIKLLCQWCSINRLKQNKQNIFAKKT